MVTALAVLVVTLLPFLAVAALLRVSDHLQARQRARYARKIALTDAIHRELGAVAAPTVSRRLGRGWRVAMAVPFDRPATLAALVEVVDRATAAWEEPKGGAWRSCSRRRGRRRARRSGARPPLPAPRRWWAPHP
jgi:hypothetical protein